MEEASRVELIKDIKYKLIELCQIDMCILVLANHFMLYMNNIQVFDEQCQWLCGHSGHWPVHQMGRVVQNVSGRGLGSGCAVGEGV